MNRPIVGHTALRWLGCGALAAWLCLASGWAANPASQMSVRPFTGTVTHVTDGDTLWVRPSGGGEPVAVRLQGIDAPEICQPQGLEAKTALMAKTLHRAVTIHPRTRDGWHRTVARVHLDGQDLGQWLVQQGWAWSPGHQHHPGPYAAEQAQARAARAGLWAQPEAIPPRSFRRQHGPCH